MTRLSERLPYLLATIAGGVLLWEAWDLQVWDAFGTGPGLFPRAVILVIIAIGALLSLFPRLVHEPDETAATEDDTAPEMTPEAATASRRTMLCYAAGLVYLGFAAAYLGFVLLCVTVSLLLTWWTERRGVLPAMIFGLAIGIGGLVVFSLLLKVTIPLSEVDRTILRLLR